MDYNVETVLEKVWLTSFWSAEYSVHDLAIKLSQCLYKRALLYKHCESSPPIFFGIVITSKLKQISGKKWTSTLQHNCLNLRYLCYINLTVFLLVTVNWFVTCFSTNCFLNHILFAIDWRWGRWVLKWLSYLEFRTKTFHTAQALPTN